MKSDDTSRLKHFGDNLEITQATEQIERWLAQAFGHGACEGILRRAAQQLNDYAECQSWGPDLRKQYLRDDHVLSPYIKADLERWADLKRSYPEGVTATKLTADESALVIKHWPLVESEAYRIARKDEELRDRLTELGRAELEKAVRRFDITRHVTFGAFVRQRIRGCMLNYINRVWKPEPKEVPVGDRDKRWFKGMTRRPRSSRTARAMLRPPEESRLIPGKRSQGVIDAALAAALAKLTPRQRAVYEGRVLTKPPLSRETIARQLGIADVTQISRILKQARRKMRGLT